MSTGGSSLESGPMESGSAAAETETSRSASATESGDIQFGRGGFTSEIYKIEITNLPNHFGFSQLKKRLTTTLGLKPHKIKALPNKPFAFVCFSCEEDRQLALEKINGHVWKGRNLSAKKAQPSPDPLKRKLEAEASKDDGGDGSKRSKSETDNMTPEMRLRCSVMPLWDLPYEQQLKTKSDTVFAALKDVSCHPEVRHILFSQRKQFGGICCEFLPVVSSPVLEHYRNKSEFSIGRGEDGSEILVGFRFGLYKEGTDCVGSPSLITIILPAAQTVVVSFQRFVRESKYPPFYHRDHTGHWRQLTVRTTRNDGGIMAIAEFVMQNVTEEEKEELKAKIKEFFTEGEGKSAGITTFYFRPCTAKSSSSNSEEPYELIYGEGYIYETVLDMKFRISPNAFFQVNTAGAEILYKLIAEFAGATEKTTVLDVCCGTGTIGLSMAKNVANVIGIEMCQQAVEDAKHNAKINEITNATYSCAKVEDCIDNIIAGLSTDDVVAILDPPRAGIHRSVIKALRRCRYLKRIVYAACNPTTAKTNFVDLIRPGSKKNRGEPFQFVKAVPVDMFPHTKHCELVVLFERGMAPNPDCENDQEKSTKDSATDKKDGEKMGSASHENGQKDSDEVAVKVEEEGK